MIRFANHKREPSRANGFGYFPRKESNLLSASADGFDLAPARPPVYKRFEEAQENKAGHHMGQHI